jgi:hypothetical protein
MVIQGHQVLCPLAALLASADGQPPLSDVTSLRQTISLLYQAIPDYPRP